MNEEMMQAVLAEGFGIEGYRCVGSNRLKGGGLRLDLEPIEEPKAPVGQRLVRHGGRWRKLRGVSIGFTPVWLRVRVPRWLNTTTGEEFEQSPPLPTSTAR